MSFCSDFLVTLERERGKKWGVRVTFVTLTQNGQELHTEEKFLRANEIAKREAVRKVRIFFFWEKGERWWPVNCEIVLLFTLVT
jgi:hypothetical protein